MDDRRLSLFSIARYQRSDRSFSGWDRWVYACRSDGGYSLIVSYAEGSGVLVLLPSRMIECSKIYPEKVKENLRLTVKPTRAGSE